MRQGHQSLQRQPPKGISRALHVSMNMNTSASSSPILILIRMLSMNRATQRVCGFPVQLNSNRDAYS